MLDPSPFLLSHLSPRHLFLPWQRPCFKYFASANDNDRAWASVRTHVAHPLPLAAATCPIPRRYLLALTRCAPYPRPSLLALATPLLRPRYLSRRLFLCLASAMVRESRAQSCRAFVLLTSLCASSSSPCVPRQPGEVLWLGPGQVQVQLAATRPRHHPRPPAGQN